MRNPFAASDMTETAPGDWALPALQARSQEKRDRLLESGLHLVEKTPFATLSVSDIADGADCAVGTFYRRFPDKRHFLFALQELANRDFLARLESGPPDDTGPAETVRSMVALLVEDRRRRRGLATASLREATTNDGAWMPFYEAAVGCDRHLRRRLPGIDAAEIGFATQALYGILNQTTLLRAGAVLLDDDALIDRLTALTCRYLGLGDA